MDNNGFSDSFRTQTATLDNASFEDLRIPRLREDRDKDTIPAAVDSRVIADAQGTRLSEKGHPAFAPPAERPKHHFVRWIVITLIVAAIVAAVIHWGLPMVREALDTVSTDDAFVAGHITNVSPRVEGVVTEVLVDQNDRVEAGALLLRLDRQPFEVAARAGRRPRWRRRGRA